MKIAILGWGSLLWDPRPEFDKQHDDCWKYNGPELKIEFSRKSDSREGALTLVIDEENGTLTKVAWCLSKRSNVEDAACDLRCREGTICRNIRCIVVAEAVTSQNIAGNSVLDWARREKLDAVVWTGLESNFKPFTVDLALSYLKGLSPAGKAKAFEYFVRAPAFVKTEVRSALEKEPWFKE
jgi:hypothetical protein